MNIKEVVSKVSRDVKRKSSKSASGIRDQSCQCQWSAPPPALEASKGRQSSAVEARPDGSSARSKEGTRL